MHPDEGLLIARVQQGDTAAFGELVGRYQSRLYTLAYRMLGQREEAEDTVQEAFVQAFRALHRFRPGERFAPWIYRIATNLCIDALRKRRYRQLSLDSPVLEDADRYRYVAGGGNSPEEELLAADLRRWLERAVGALPPNYRAVVVLRHVQGLSYQEIAAVLGVPLGTVKTRLFRAREILRRQLEAEGRERPGRVPGA
jgi:RNA polymerase sigma-70 factor (ECF subfamily)